MRESQSHRPDLVNSDVFATTAQQEEYILRRNPTVLIWSIPTLCPWMRERNGPNRRNPTVLIWSIPTLRGLQRGDRARDSRNPTVLIWSIPTTGPGCHRDQGGVPSQSHRPDLVNSDPAVLRMDRKEFDAGVAIPPS